MLPAGPTDNALSLDEEDSVVSKIIEFIFGLIFPKSPKVLRQIVAVLVPHLAMAVQRVIADDRIEAPETISEVRGLLEATLATVPAWAVQSESRRDAILHGLTELALFIYEVSDKDKDHKVSRHELRGTLKHMKKRLRKLGVPN